MSHVVLWHLSDLHFGDRELAFQGAHTVAGLRALTQFRRKHIRSFLAELGLPRDHAFYCVVSGDITRRGLATSLAAARMFLCHSPSFVDQDRIGLAMLPERIVLVPGNHDHWGGGGFLGLPVFDERVRARIPTGEIRPLWSEDGQLCVELLGLDSSSGYEGGGQDSALLQGGRLSNEQLEAFGAWPERVEGSPTYVRAVILHHDLGSERARVRMAARTFRKHGNLCPWPLEGSSREALIERCKRAGVGPILTGHVHHPDVQVLAEGDHGPIVELRAGSCLEGRLRSGRQSFFIHHISTTGANEARWETHVFHWDRETATFAPRPEVFWRGDRTDALVTPRVHD